MTNVISSPDVQCQLILDGNENPRDVFEFRRKVFFGARVRAYARWIRSISMTWIVSKYPPRTKQLPTTKPIDPTTLIRSSFEKPSNKHPTTNTSTMDVSPRYFSESGVRRRQTGGRKRLRILVVHDFDLKSTAKLAESSLLSSNNIRTHRGQSSDILLERSVDLCIAVNSAADSSTSEGLYDLKDELLPYYQGPARRSRMLKTASRMGRHPQTSYTYASNGTEVRDLRGRPRIGKKVLSTSFRSIPVPVPLPPVSQPIFFNDDNYDGTSDCRIDYESHLEVDNIDNATNLDSSTEISPEERAARRGLITAALSQLESIVCRVVYMLKDDCVSRKSDDHEHLRLTSNSLDIQNRWLPLVEGLGLAGHLDANDQIDNIGLGDQPLERLLRSAHPLSSADQNEDHILHDQEALLFQSIVITAARARKRSLEKSEGSPDQQEDLKGESSRQPETENYNKTKNSFVRDHLLLKIAAGAEASPSSHCYSTNGDATTTVITPGSLRKRGEFCLVDLILDDEVATIDDGDFLDNAGKSKRPFRWRVEQAQFHRLESEQDAREWA